MTTAETLATARSITRGSTCFVIPHGDRFKVCRRIGRRIVSLGHRSDPARLFAWLRRLTRCEVA